MHCILNPHVSVLHSDRDDWSKDIESLSHNPSGLKSVGLQEAVEHLQNYPLVDGKSGNDVGQQEVTVVLGGWVLENGSKIEGREMVRLGQRDKVKWDTKWDSGIEVCYVILFSRVNLPQYFNNSKAI